MKTWVNSFVTGAVAILGVSAYAIQWDGGGFSSTWSDPENWEGDHVPDSNTEAAEFSSTSHLRIEVDRDCTIQSWIDGFNGEGTTNKLYGAGTLTIDRNKNGWPAILNATGYSGGTLRINNAGGMVFSNSAGGNMLVRNDNSPGNVILFDSESRLTLLTALQTAQGAGGAIRFNGQFLPAAANLIIASDNVYFGPGHDSSSFGRDMVFYSGAKLMIDGGTVLNSNRKFQVNGNSELVLNAANAINDANIVTAAGSSLRIDVNADQTDLGFLRFDSGTVSLDLDKAVSTVAFDDSSAQPWGAGTLVISNFTPGVVFFGTDAGGLTAGQLKRIKAFNRARISEGKLALNENGALVAGR